MARDFPLERVRNIGIAAHIDAGKTTTTERILFYSGVVHKIGEVHDGAAVTDWMAQERERGITIKLHAVRMMYNGEDGEAYVLNLIDTPGHVDFTYEVSRSLAACEGALLVVDSGQGVEAQSVATCYTAIEQGLEVIPVLNKMDLPQAEPDRVRIEIEEIIGIDASDAVCVSAKTGMGVEELLEEIMALGLKSLLP